MTIQQAIHRSIQSAEIVTVKVDDLATALSDVECNSETFDRQTVNDGIVDVWGETANGDQFRIYLKEVE